MKPTYSEVIGRLKKISGAKNEKEVADFLGLGKQNLYDSRKRDSVPYRTIVEKISETPYDLDYVLLGRASPTGTGTRMRIGEEKQISDPSEAFVRYYPNVQASAGFGIDNENSEHIYIYLPNEILRREAKDTHAVHIIGDSMETTIFDGDIVLISHAAIDCEPRNGKIFVLRIDGKVFIKRLTRAGSEWMSTSDNPKYQPVSLKREDFEIFGRVFKRIEDI